MKYVLMAIDQYGQKHDIGPTDHPRKSIMEHFYVSTAEPMYQDKKDGTSVQVGYIIHVDGSELWLTLYNVTPWERKT